LNSEPIARITLIFTKGLQLAGVDSTPDFNLKEVTQMVLLAFNRLYMETRRADDPDLGADGNDHLGLPQANEGREAIESDGKESPESVDAGLGRTPDGY
jgi:hypothetical protein